MKVCESCTFQVVFVGAPNVSFPEYNEWETWKTCGNFVETLSKVGKSSLVRSISTGRPEVQNNDATMRWVFLFFVSWCVDTCVDAGQQLSLYHTTAHNWCFPQFEVFEVEVLRSDAKPQSRKPLWHQCAWFAQVICGISSLAHLCWFMDWMLKAWQKSDTVSYFRYLNHLIILLKCVDCQRPNCGLSWLEIWTRLWCSTSDVCLSKRHSELTLKNVRRKPQPNGQAYHGFRAHMNWKYWLKVERFGLTRLIEPRFHGESSHRCGFRFWSLPLHPWVSYSGCKLMQTPWKFMKFFMKSVWVLWVLWVLWVWGFWMWMNKWSFVSLSGQKCANRLRQTSLTNFDLTFVPGLDFLAGHGLTSSARLTLKKRKPRRAFSSRENFWLLT